MADLSARPAVTIWTNSRAGSMGTTIGATFASERTTAASATLGADLLHTLTASRPGTVLETPALRDPVTAVTQPTRCPRTPAAASPPSTSPFFSC